MGQCCAKSNKQTMQNLQSEIITHMSDSTDYNKMTKRALRHNIIKNHLHPHYDSEIEDALRWIRLWRKISSVFFTVTFITMASTSILTFSSAAFPDDRWLMFFAGSASIFGLSFERFAHYCDGRSKLSTEKANQILKSVGIQDIIPDISDLALDNNMDPQNNDEQHMEPKHNIISPVNKLASDDKPTAIVDKLTSGDKQSASGDKQSASGDKQSASGDKPMAVFDKSNKTSHVIQIDTMLRDVQKEKSSNIVEMPPY